MQTPGAVRPARPQGGGLRAGEPRAEAPWTGTGEWSFRTPVETEGLIQIGLYSVIKHADTQCCEGGSVHVCKETWLCVCVCVCERE